MYPVCCCCHCCQSVKQAIERMQAFLMESRSKQSFSKDMRAETDTVFLEDSPAAYI